MTQSAADIPFTPRERLRWRRAMDAQLAMQIFGRVVRDETPPPMPIPARDAFARPVSVEVR